MFPLFAFIYVEVLSLPTVFISVRIYSSYPHKRLRVLLSGTEKCRAQLYCVEIEGFEPSSSHFASYTLKLFVNVLMISQNIRFKAIYVRSKTFIHIYGLAIPTYIYVRLERTFWSYILYGDATDLKFSCVVFL